VAAATVVGGLVPLLTSKHSQARIAIKVRPSLKQGSYPRSVTIKLSSFTSRILSSDSPLSALWRSVCSRTSLGWNPGWRVAH